MLMVAAPIPPAMNNAESASPLTTFVGVVKPLPRAELNSVASTDVASVRLLAPIGRESTAVFVTGDYEGANRAVLSSVWSTGDWNGDRDFTSSDLTLALADGGYEAGPRQAAVPEPRGAAMVLVGLFSFLIVLRRHR